MLKEHLRASDEGTACPYRTQTTGLEHYRNTLGQPQHRWSAMGRLAAIAPLLIAGAVHSPAHATPDSLPPPVSVARNAPYVPTPMTIVMEMLKLAEVSKGDVVYDLGSGDGRIAIAAVQRFGARQGVGVEFNSDLVSQSRANARQAGVSDRVKFLQQDFFKTDIREATVVTLYLLPEINLKLQPKLLNELKPGTRIVSQSFTLGEWQPDKVYLVPGLSRRPTLYYWIVPANIGGTWQGTLSSDTGQSMPIRLTLNQQFQKIDAIATLDEQTINLSGLILAGNQLRFSRRETLNGQRVTLRFNGQLEEGMLKGTAEIQTQRAIERYRLTAKRQ